MLDLSVVIVNWNTRSLLEKCLESVLAQAEEISMEVFVVDNASTDGSPEMVCSRFPRVRLLVNETNQGFAKANNRALRLSRGRVIALINPDTVLMDGCLKNMLAFMDAHPEVGAAGGKILNEDGSVDFFRSAKKFPTPLTKFFVDLGLDRLFPCARCFGRYSLAGWDREDVREVDVLSGAFMFVRRETIEEAGMLDEDYFILGEDMDWCRRIKEKGWKILFNPDAAVLHYGGKSIDRVKMTRLRNALFSNLLYFQKHHGSWPALEFRLLLSVTNLLRAAGWIIRLVSGENRKVSWNNAVSHLQAFILCYTMRTGYRKE